MSKTIFVGSFDAEYFWRDNNYSKLPSIPNCHGDRIIGAMEELQFVFCTNPEDLLITRYTMDSLHKQYLDSLGFKFVANDKSIEIGNCTTTRKSIFELLNASRYSKNIPVSLSDFPEVSPYAILPNYFDFCNIHKVPHVAASEDVVKKVNSKVYSNDLSAQLFGNKNGHVIYSAEQLAEVGMKLLSENKQFLVKDEFGVSGNGNIHITNPKFLSRIVKLLANQEGQGKNTRFLVEGYLDKEIDFSCQFNISSTGGIAIHSIQEMKNNGFSFSSIKSADSQLLSMLDNSDYYEQVEMLGKQLFNDNYFGAVCLDSMVEKNGNIVPVIEINARKSMGLVNHYLDKYLSQFDSKGLLGYYSLQIPRHLKFSDVFDKLEMEEILFTKERPAGFIPLSANCFSVNANYLESEPRYQGRFYASVIAKDIEEQNQFYVKLNKVFADLGIIYNG